MHINELLNKQKNIEPKQNKHIYVNAFCSSCLPSRGQKTKAQKAQTWSRVVVKYFYLFIHFISKVHSFVSQMADLNGLMFDQFRLTQSTCMKDPMGICIQVKPIVDGHSNWQLNPDLLHTWIDQNSTSCDSFFKPSLYRSVSAWLSLCALPFSKIRPAYNPSLATI